MHDENKQQEQPQTEGNTRKVPTVSGKQQPVNNRRRRAERVRPVDHGSALNENNENHDENNDTIVLPSEQPQNAARQPSALNRVETRFDLERQQEENGKTRSVPQPAALERARQAKNAREMRRVADAPDYVERAPLGADDAPHRRSMFAQPPRELFDDTGSPDMVPAAAVMSREKDELEVPQKRESPTPAKTKLFTSSNKIVRPLPAASMEDTLQADYDEEDEDRIRRMPVLTIVVCVVLVIALAVLGLLLVPEDNTSVIGELKRSISGKNNTVTTQAQALDFSGTPTEGTAPLTACFSLTTNNKVENVRLVNEFGVDLNATAEKRVSSGDVWVWVLNLDVNQPFNGRVIPQLNDGNRWVDSGKWLTMSVSAPITTNVTSAVPTYTAAPTAEPTEEPTPEPTAAPTVEPVVEITTEPVVGNTGIPLLVLWTDAPEQPEIENLPDIDIDPEPDDETTPDDEILDDDEASVGFLPDLSNDPDAVPAVEDAIVSATPTLAPTATPTVMPRVQTVMPSTVIVEDEMLDEDVTNVTTAAEATATAVPTATPTPAPTATPAPTPLMENGHLVARAADSALPSLIADSTIYSSGSKKISTYNREVEKVINMPDAENYMVHPFGVITFRGSSFRQNAAFGNVSAPTQMNVAWTYNLGKVKSSDGKWFYGIGWTGQPAIVKWSKDVRVNANIAADKQDKVLKEVIAAGLDGKIYFLDLDDGTETRKPINVGYPMRGTPSISPVGYPMMTVGQYARKMASGTGGIGLRFYNLMNQKEMTMIDGLDGKINRPYNGVGSFETSALMDPKSDTLVTIGTNGMLYLMKMGTSFSLNDCEIRLDKDKMETITMTSRTAKQADKYTAVESSMAMYGSYVFYADMQGILRCVDTSTLTTMWAVNTGDAVEASIALDLDENGNLWLYTANELSIRGKGEAQVRRFNAMTGEEDWLTGVHVTKPKNNNYIAGFRASPVIGCNELSNLVYFTVSGVSKDGAAKLGGSAAMPSVLMAMEKTTGEVVWTKEMSAYTYSSPVAVYDADGRGWLVQACSDGTLYLLNGLTGETVNTLKVKGTIEASPAVYGSTLVIGTTGKDSSFLYGIALE